MVVLACISPHKWCRKRVRDTSWRLLRTDFISSSVFPNIPALPSPVSDVFYRRKQKQEPTQRRMIFCRCTIFRLAKPAFFRYNKYSTPTKNHSTLCRLLLLFSSLYTWSRLDHYWSNVHLRDHRSGCLLKRFIEVFIAWRYWHSHEYVLPPSRYREKGAWERGCSMAHLQESKDERCISIKGGSFFQH